ncbi:unnamed protein product [Pieris macdunnoughi]|uniref:Uncharacterized protein n=1 Tax=Pieris macdunnoughi TaxID=345717 RepID=A0A821SDD2_9NEOP|nr:unnamed protein product [Pieris macdunnoughi]
MRCISRVIHLHMHRVSALNPLLGKTFLASTLTNSRIMVKKRTVPGAELTKQIVLDAAWLAFIYMLLLTLFELIELLRPKPSRFL